MIRALYALGRDSFREARDRAVSRVLVILSVVLAGVVACFGFKPVEARDFFGHVLRSGGYEVRDVKEVAARGRGRAFRVEVGLRGASDVDAAEEARIERTVRRALEARRIRVESLSSAADADGRRIEIACGFDDALDVPGLMRVSVAGLFEIPLDFGRTEGLELMGPLSARTFLTFVIENTIAGLFGGWVGIIIALVATAGFVPSMLQPGTSHLLLAKPVPRAVLLVAKYLGGVAFVLYHALVIAALVAAAIFARTGWLDTRFLLVAPLLAGLFAIIYAVSCTLGVIFESPVTSILLALGFWFGCWGIATAREVMAHTEVKVPVAATRVVDAVYWILPKTSDLGRLSERIVNEGRETPMLAELLRKAPKPDFRKSLATSAAFTAVMLGLGCYVFRKKDY